MVEKHISIILIPSSMFLRITHEFDALHKFIIAFPSNIGPFPSPTTLAKRGMRKVMVTRRAAPRREGSLVTQPCLGNFCVRMDYSWTG